MTEDEAKTKWCPFARMWTPEGAINRASDLPHNEHSAIRCLGSACMAWRVVEQDKSESVRAWQQPAGSGWLKTAEHTYDTLPEWTRRVDRAGTGFCGLAGKP